MKWEQKTLAELCTKLTDGTHDSPKLQLTGMPFIKGVHVKQGIIDFENCDYITYEEHEKVIKRSKPEKNDILLANIGINIGELGYVKTDIEFSIKNVALLKVNQDEIDSRYLYYNLKNPLQQERLRNHKGGSAQPFLSLETLRGYKIQFQKLISTQRKIATILSAYDDLIENNLKRIKLLEEKAFASYKSIVNSEKLVKVSVFEYAEIMSGGTPSTINHNYWEGEIPFFTPKDLSTQSGYYLDDTERKITELGLEKCNSRLFPRDTIFITARGTVGKLVLAKIPSAISQSNYAITTRNGSSNYFLFLALVDKIDHFKQLAVGGVFDTIIVDTFKMIFIELPKEEIINQFNIEIKQVFQLIDILQKQNTKLRLARDILLPKLMSGQIEV